MKNKIILLPSRFIFLLAIIIFTACEKVDLDDINTGSEGDNNVNIITRSDSEIQYPLYIIAFDGEGNAVKKTTIETAATKTSFALDAGAYHIVAIGGIEDCDMPDIKSLNDVVTLPSDNYLDVPIQMGSTDLMVTQNATATITLYNQVAAFDLSLTDIPDNATEVSVSMSMLSNELSFIGATSGNVTATVNLDRQTNSSWSSTRFYILPNGDANKLTMTISIVSPAGHESFGYTHSGAIYANTPYVMVGSFKQGFSVNNVISLAGWNKAEEISFTFGSDDEDEQEDDDEISEMPEIGSIWKNHLVAAIEYTSETSADIILLSLSEWSGISSAYNTEVPNMANDIASSYTEDGLKDWKIPTKEEAKLIVNSIGMDNLSATNETLAANQYTVLKFGEDIENDAAVRYLCDDAKSSFSWTVDATSKAGSKRTYHLRLVNRISRKIADAE